MSDAVCHRVDTSECAVVAPARFARNIAVDTAGQQSATSFVISFSGRRCPSAKDAFIRTANAFCNGASLYFPWPGTKGDEEELPKMLLLWPKEHRHDLPTSDAKPPQASAGVRDARLFGGGRRAGQFPRRQQTAGRASGCCGWRVAGVLLARPKSSPPSRWRLVPGGR